MCFALFLFCLKKKEHVFSFEFFLLLKPPFISPGCTFKGSTRCSDGPSPGATGLLGPCLPGPCGSLEATSSQEELSVPGPPSPEAEHCRLGLAVWGLGGGSTDIWPESHWPGGLEAESPAPQPSAFPPGP